MAKSLKGLRHRNLRISLDSYCHSHLLCRYGILNSTFSILIGALYSHQKAALEVHDKEAKSVPKTPTLTITEEIATSAETVRVLILPLNSCSHPDQTVKGKNKAPEESTLKPPSGDPYARRGGGSTGRGDLDQAIRSMRKGTRKDRPRPPANRVFLDGARNSRVFD